MPIWCGRLGLSVMDSGYVGLIDSSNDTKLLCTCSCASADSVLAHLNLYINRIKMLVESL
jgi:hypothetical protein